MIFRLVLVILFVGLAIYGIGRFLSPNDLADCVSPGTSHECRKAGAIVVISGGDTEARTARAIELYQAGWAPYIVFSGAAADKDGPSNAEVMQEQALGAGVPKSASVIEDKSETTKQNAEKVRQQLLGINAKDIILVTSGYHMRRASLEFSAQLGSDFSIRRHPSSGDKHWGAVWWLTPWGWWLALSELVKVGLFYVGGTR